MPTPEELKEREQAHKRKELGVDQRKAGDVARWLEHQVAEGDAPELVVLAGNHLGRSLVGTWSCTFQVQGKCEALTLPWIGISTRRRVYILGTGPPARRVKASTLLEGDYRAIYGHVALSFLSHMPDRHPADDAQTPLAYAG